MEWLILGLFCAALLLSIFLNISVLVALGFGLLLFLYYGRRKGFSWPELGRMTLQGVKTIKNILIAFLLIGVLTAFWRAAGTIPVIVCYASALIRPSVFLLMTFLLNSGMSVLTGTSFGTSVTMGVICATMGTAMGIDIRLIGGAVLAGAFVGDRCSPVSTSAFLVATLTETSIYDNIKRMIRTALVPFLLTCAIYAAAGLFLAPSGERPDLQMLFASEFHLHWTAILPAAVILGLSFFRVNVKWAMGASILTAFVICLAVQHVPLLELLKTAVLGFEAQGEEVAVMLNGGGIVSMVRVTCVVCLSSSYSFLFQRTGLLDKVKMFIEHAAAKTTRFTGILGTSVMAAMISCNQTLAVMLTHQLCKDLAPDPVDPADSSGDPANASAAADASVCSANAPATAAALAIDLEDSAIVIAPLIPWSIAGSVPLTAIGAPAAAILFACYLYLLPLWRLVCSIIKKRRR